MDKEEIGEVLLIEFLAGEITFLPLNNNLVKDEFKPFRETSETYMDTTNRPKANVPDGSYHSVNDTT